MTGDVFNRTVLAVVVRAAELQRERLALGRGGVERPVECAGRSVIPNVSNIQLSYLRVAAVINIDRFPITPRRIQGFAAEIQRLCIGLPGGDGHRVCLVLVGLFRGHRRDNIDLLVAGENGQQ